MTYRMANSVDPNQIVLKEQNCRFSTCSIRGSIEVYRSCESFNVTAYSFLKRTGMKCSMACIGSPYTIIKYC